MPARTYAESLSWLMSSVTIESKSIGFLVITKNVKDKFITN